MINSEDWAALVVFCLVNFKRDPNNPKQIFTYLNRLSLMTEDIYVKFHMLFSSTSSRDACQLFINDQGLDSLIHVHPMSLDDIDNGITIDQFQEQLIGKFF